MPRSYTLSALLLCVGFLGCGRAETASYPVDGLAGGKEIARTVPSTIPGEVVRLGRSVAEEEAEL